MTACSGHGWRQPVRARRPGRGGWNISAHDVVGAPVPEHRDDVSPKEILVGAPGSQSPLRVTQEAGDHRGDREGLLARLGLGEGIAPVLDEVPERQGLVPGGGKAPGGVVADRVTPLPRAAFRAVDVAPGFCAGRYPQAQAPRLLVIDNEALAGRGAQRTHLDIGEQACRQNSAREGHGGVTAKRYWAQPVGSSRNRILRLSLCKFNVFSSHLVAGGCTRKGPSNVNR